MAYNKSTVGVLVYLYISFIAIVGLLALIQPSHGAEATDDDLHVNHLPPKEEQNEKDEHSLPLSLSHDLQDGNRVQQKDENQNSNSNNNINIDKQYQQKQQEQVNHEKDLMSQQGHLVQEPPSTGDADVLQEQEAKEGSNSPANESSLTMVAKQLQQQQPSPVKSPVRVECKMLLESGDEPPGVRLVNSSQIFSYLDRIHGTVVDVNDTKSNSSSINNNTSSNFSDGMNSGNSGDGSEKMEKSAKRKEEEAAAASPVEGSGEGDMGDEVRRRQREGEKESESQRENEKDGPGVSDEGGQTNVVINGSGSGDVTLLNVQQEEGEKVTVYPSSQASHCALVLFYYPWCIFSAKAAPAFNTIGRIFPQIRVLALDAYADTGLNMRFGLVGVPTILFFHNSKLIAKYNDSTVTLEGLVTFINKITGLTPVDSPVITQMDLLGPVPTSPVKTLDFVVIICWIFVLLCATYFFVNSSLFAKLIECIRNNWREAQAAQHQHTD